MLTIVAQYYAKMKCLFVTMPEGITLFASDNPVVKRNTTPESERNFYNRGLGVANRAIEVWFPISPRTLLVIAHDVEALDEYGRLVDEGRRKEAEEFASKLDPATEHGFLPADVANDVVATLAGNAHRFVYTNRRNDQIPALLSGPSRAPYWGVG